MRRIIFHLTLVTAGVIAVAGCGSGGSTAGGTLTVWTDGACTTPCPEAAVAKLFEKEHRGVKVKLVTQPIDNYYQTLLAQSISKRGPDVAALWPGGYWSNVEPYLVDLRQTLHTGRLKKSPTSQYYAVNSDLNGKVVAAPFYAGIYLAFYNKQSFAKAGIDGPPTSWKTLFADAKKLKAAGITPILEGPGSSGAAELTPLQEWSYLAAALPAKKWNSLISGQLPYDNPMLVDQVTKWHQLYADGYMNRDALTAKNIEQQFEAGKGAMLLNNGSWSIAAYGKAMGKNLGVFVPPYSVGEQHAICEVDGLGYGVMNYSSHVALAKQFVKLMFSDAGQRIVAKAGQPPAIPQYQTPYPLLNKMLRLVKQPETKLYPQYDTFTQPAVTNALNQYLPQALVGHRSPSSALKAVDRTLASLPAKQRNVDYNIGA